MAPNGLNNGDPVSPSAPRRRAAQVVTCVVCGKSVQAAKTTALAALRPSLLERMRQDYPDLPADGPVCFGDVEHYRGKYVAELLHKERGELSELDREVIQSIREGDTISANTDAEFAQKITVGERLSDALARFGGSWIFIILFGVVIVVWMIINAAAAGAAFDPFPFILLNLVLSCLAAAQAPIILMSQNRQEVKDRLRSDNDYRVNLKAELEIRHLHEKMDHLINRQWERLAEIQEIQLEIMQDIAGRRSR
jgi:uncharacterized membrane protein